MSKPILVNSYHRSGSVFFAELLLRSRPPYGIRNVSVSVVHVPELIGIKEAWSATIFRDPFKAIASNIFKHTGVFGLPENLDGMAQNEALDYIRYIDAVKKTRSYAINFNSLSKDPVKEANRFFSHHVLEGYSEPSLKDVEAVFEKHKYQDTVHTGHIPRGVDNHEEYNFILSHIQTNPVVLQAKELYLDFIKEFPDE